MTRKHAVVTLGGSNGSNEGRNRDCKKGEPGPEAETFPTPQQQQGLCCRVLGNEGENGVGDDGIMDSPTAGNGFVCEEWTDGRMTLFMDCCPPALRIQMPKKPRTCHSGLYGPLAFLVMPSFCPVWPRETGAQSPCSPSPLLVITYYLGHNKLPWYRNDGLAG
jgi:hypothetical protein